MSFRRVSDLEKFFSHTLRRSHGAFHSACVDHNSLIDFVNMRPLS